MVNVKTLDIQWLIVKKVKVVTNITNEKNICNNGLINFPINININETGPINLSFNTYHIKINDNKPTKEYNVRFDGLQRDLRF